MSDDQMTPGEKMPEVNRPSAMQIKPQGEYRAFNPDRDLVYCLPRLISRALHDLGEEVDVGAVQAALLNRGLGGQHLLSLAHERGKNNAEALVDLWCEVTREMGQYFARMVAEPGNAEKSAPELLRSIFAVDRGPVRNAVRQLICDMIVRRMMAEFPFWVEQAQPWSEKAARPYEDDINEAVDKFIAVLDDAK